MVLSSSVPQLADRRGRACSPRDRVASHDKVRADRFVVYSTLNVTPSRSMDGEMPSGVSRRCTPERLYTAHRAATTNRLIVEGELPDPCRGEGGRLGGWNGLRRPTAGRSLLGDAAYRWIAE